ncbi:MAG: prenyltransferase/squalene oxidase repeat-containing protein [Gemmataceae bacterium]
MSYLQRLTELLAQGVRQIPAERRQRHVRFLTASQNRDGGFSGREGGSDLYYTGFALRSLSLLEALTPRIAEPAGQFLRGSLAGQTSVVDFFSLLYASLLVQVSSGLDIFADSPPDWPQRVADLLESFRTADGGYAKGPGGAAGSTYHSFLVTLCYQLLGREVPKPDRLVEFALSRRRDDGGFVEIAPMRRSGTNPTAAGVGLLQVVTPQIFTEQPVLRQGVIDFLVEMASVEGGIRANGRVPLADLLSTFTGGWTLAELGGLDRLDRTDLRHYAEAAELPQGGFRGGLWDDGHDVEYTFYGLGVLGLVHLRGA